MRSMDESGSGVRHHGQLSKKHPIHFQGVDSYSRDGNRIEEGSDAGGIVLFRRIFPRPRPEVQGYGQPLIECLTKKEPKTPPLLKIARMGRPHLKFKPIERLARNARD